MSTVFQDIKPKRPKKGGIGKFQRIQGALQKHKLMEYKARDSLQRLNEGETFNSICAAMYHLPSTVELAAAKRVSEGVQRTALVRNWHRIRMAFDLSGSLLLPGKIAICSLYLVVLLAGLLATVVLSGSVDEWVMFTDRIVRFNV